MKLEDLLKLIPEESQSDVTLFVKGFDEKITTLTGEITALENKMSDGESTVAKEKEKLDEAIRKRDAAKAQLVVVRDALGLPADKEVTRDLIAEHLKDSSKGDAQKDKQIQSLKNSIEELEKAVEDQRIEKDAAVARCEEISAERDNIAEETKFLKVFSETMPQFKAASQLARVDIEKLMRTDAVLEEGKIWYKSGDTYIRIGGEKMDMKMRLAQIQENPDYDYLFLSNASSGSGSGNGGSASSGSRFEQRKRKAGIN